MIVKVAVNLPQTEPLDYSFDTDLSTSDVVGRWVLVPLRKKLTLGLIIEAVFKIKTKYKLKKINELLGELPKMDKGWLELIQFSSNYYHKSLGQTVFSSVPRTLKNVKTYETVGKTSKIEKLISAINKVKKNDYFFQNLLLNSEQKIAVTKILDCEKPILLHGVTGSGKTRVYAKIIQEIIKKNPDSQILLLVPEIGLTPQIFKTMSEMLEGLTIFLFHSEQTPISRAKIWLSSSKGDSLLIIGTRVSIFLPLPKLKLIIIDEEHDTSFKQQEGIRYSARNLAIWRGKKVGCKTILGSATPSLESWWFHKQGKHERVRLSKQATGRPLAKIKPIKLDIQGERCGISKQSEEKIKKTLLQKQQILVYINKKGWAPVLGCIECGWAADCNNCSSHMVLHKVENKWKLICHHCGNRKVVYKICPDCSSPDIKPIGQGTEKIEENLATMFPDAKILRMDREKIRGRKSLESCLDQINKGKVDIIVGTQMITKGHDFPNLTFVLAVDVDSQLKNTDFRAPERLFASLSQVAGRAGRHHVSNKNEAEFIVETRNPGSEFFKYLQSMDEEGFYRKQLYERKSHLLPPFTNMGAIKLSHKNEDTLFLGLELLERIINKSLRENFKSCQDKLIVNGPLPLYPLKISNRYRGQLVLESENRNLLHNLISSIEGWKPLRNKFNGFIDIDPIEI
ncbi:MAG: primosomal protein N' [Betaproteobacteria bacterium TMED41]|nr:MAG: primosomal protein N' [Betaproteobacteria bacterium TMED41]